MARPQRKQDDKKPVTEQTAHYETSGATILSREPALVPETSDKIMSVQDWGILRSHLDGRLVQLRAWRTSWWMQNWSDLSEFILPRRSIWLTQSSGGTPTPNNMTRGLEINTSIVDPTATFAVRICTGGLVSGLASPSRPWFKITAMQNGESLDQAGRQWIDETEERIYNVLAVSNFYNSFAQECEDLIVFGTAPTIIYEDATDLIRCYNPCVGEYYVANDGALRANGLFRQFLMTVIQMVDFFGVENCPPDIQKLWEEKGSGLDQERIINHAIEPNFAVAGKSGQKSAGVVPGNFAWREVYWCMGAGDGPLSIRGFVDKPFTVSRWATQSNDAYGRSPGMDVLPDVLQLQVETQRKAEALEKNVRPPLVADMSLKNQPSSILPGHVTYVQNLSAQSGMRPIYEVQPDIRGISEDIANIQQRIQRGLFNDLFLMLESAPQKDMTAYEVAQKMQEKLAVLGPVIEGMLNILKEKLKRIYGIMKRKGMVDEPPDSLKGQALNIEFVSILALAQKAAATGGIERLMALIGNMVAVYPEIKFKVKPDHIVDEMNDMLGNPQTILASGDEYKQALQAQQKQQQEVQKAQMAQHAAQTASIGADAANTLANTTVGAGGNALGALLGQGGGGSQ